MCGGERAGRSNGRICINVIKLTSVQENARMPIGWYLGTYNVNESLVLFSKLQWSNSSVLISCFVKLPKLIASFIVSTFNRYNFTIGFDKTLPQEQFEIPHEFECGMNEESLYQTACRSNGFVYDWYWVWVSQLNCLYHIYQSTYCETLLISVYQLQHVCV